MASTIGGLIARPRLAVASSSSRARSTISRRLAPLGAVSFAASGPMFDGPAVCIQPILGIRVDIASVPYRSRCAIYAPVGLIGCEVGHITNKSFAALCHLFEPLALCVVFVGAE